MPLPGDTHAYELTHLRYMLHPVVESAAEASFLVGDQFRDRLLTLAELASSDTERASPLEPGPEQVLGSGMQGDANMKKFVDAALGTFPESHNMSEPAAQKEARELVYGQMRANRVANLRERLGALPKDTKLAVVEVGAGLAVPTVRRIAEQAARKFACATLVRVNLDDFQVPKALGERGISVGGLGALDALSRIDALITPHLLPDDKPGKVARMTTETEGASK